MSSYIFEKEAESGGANYESKGGTPLPRVGPRSQGWDPDHKGRTPLPRVGPRSPGYDTFKKIIVFRYKIQKKEKFIQGYALQ